MKQVGEYILEQVLRVPVSLSKKFAQGIPLPEEGKSSVTRETVWIADGGKDKLISQVEVAERFKKEGWMRTGRQMETMQDVLGAWSEINYEAVSKSINSVDVEESDGVYNSQGVYKSSSIFDSKNIVWSYKLFNCQYMLGSRDDSACSFGVRVKESIYCSYCFEVSWSHKVSRSMFVHDCTDLVECLFCAHLRSKKYCVANMQIGEEEYFRVKKMVVEWILRKYDPYKKLQDYLD